MTVQVIKSLNSEARPTSNRIGNWQKRIESAQRRTEQGNGMGTGKQVNREQGYTQEAWQNWRNGVNTGNMESRKWW